MKRKCLLGLLGLTATLGIVGSGFSAWYFDATDLTAEKSVNTYVTNLPFSEATHESLRR